MTNLFSSTVNDPLFGIALTLIAFWIGLWLNQKAKTPLVSPMLIAVLLIIGILLVFDIPYESYLIGGRFIQMLLVPATAILAVKIYLQRSLLRKNLLPVLCGALVGSAVAIVCVLVLCRLFQLDEVITASLLPKSVTAAIALPLSEQLGGIQSITTLSLVTSGLCGAMFAPYWIKWFGIKSPLAAGLAIGTASHALGTTKALELGEIEGAMSSCAIGIAGLFTVLILMFF